MASSRKRIRNIAAVPSYADTFLGPSDPSAFSSGTASTQEHVPVSQSQGRSPQYAHPFVRRPPHAPYVPLAHYVPPAMISLVHTILSMSLHTRPQYDQPPPHHPDQQPPPAPDDAPPTPEASPAPAAVHPDLMVPPNAPYARFTVEDLLQMPG
uniref:Uncharacterized protein n=1 Tax=Brassica campestris TaxID=3711 RepID=M4F350_BRACM